MKLNLRQVYLSVAFFLSILWLGMIFLVIWVCWPPLLSFLFVPLTRSSSTVLDSNVLINISGFSFSIYHSQENDSFGSLSKKFKLSESTLRSINQANNGTELKLNTSLIIPSKDGIFHVIRTGQGLADISMAYNISLADIL